ncbi:hypothetical protein Nepgr_017670 [Nepenthes gracilis]|uniref:Uncharacterized protein n=1 Tax=Nepenthes gracilis TaxID=150966 RepID=A0AAD3SRZ9_NEPGR|nr:hypothetical protein Nepgr_017670 [Nepenthes gracilis]
MNPTAAHPPQIEISSASKHMNPLFYGLPNNPSEMNFSFSRCDDLHPHRLNDLGLGFSSVILNGGDEFRNGCNSSKPSIYDLISSSSVLPNYNYTFRSSSPSSCFTTKTTSTPSISSVLPASNLQQQQIFMSGGLKNSQADSLLRPHCPMTTSKRKTAIIRLINPSWVHLIRPFFGVEQLLVLGLTLPILGHQCLI